MTTSKLQNQLEPIFQHPVTANEVPCITASALDRNGKTLYSTAHGHGTANDSSSATVTVDTPALAWSVAKVLTAIAMLQLIEQGRADILDPVSKFYPAIKELQILNGWTEDDKPILVDQSKEMLLLHLFTHTSGMGYDFFSPDLMKWRIQREEPPLQYMTVSKRELYMTPLLFEPGERYEYGVSLDCLGFCVEAISGMRLDEYCQKNIFTPLGLKNTGLVTNEIQSSGDFMTVHAKSPEGTLTPSPVICVEDREVVAGGGHFMYTSSADLSQILLCLLNKGTHPPTNSQILKPETVDKYVYTSLLPCSSDGVGEIPSLIPQISTQGSLLRGVKKGWSALGLVNLEDVPNGRKAGSMTWCGLGNVYFWVDPNEGVCGNVVSAVLPFMDPGVLHTADALERAVYGRPMAKEVGEEGSNFRMGG